MALVTCAVVVAVLAAGAAPSQPAAASPSTTSAGTGSTSAADRVAPRLAGQADKDGGVITWQLTGVEELTAASRARCPDCVATVHTGTTLGFFGDMRWWGGTVYSGGRPAAMVEQQVGLTGDLLVARKVANHIILRPDTIEPSTWNFLVTAEVKPANPSMGQSPGSVLGWVEVSGLDLAVWSGGSSGPTLRMKVAVQVPGPDPAETLAVKRAVLGLVQRYLGRYGGYGFSRAAVLGRPEPYRAAISAANVVVDPALPVPARYDSRTNTLSVREDPRAVPARIATAVGAAVWHEVTHAIEDAHGDVGTQDPPARADRNTAYMTTVWNSALQPLTSLETRARAGAGAAALAVLWKQFLARMARASATSAASGYPAQPAQLAAWFGFVVTSRNIRSYYLSGRFLPGAAGTALRAAVR